MRPLRLVAAAGLVVLLLAMTWSSLYIVEEGRQAVVLQFGRPVGQAVRDAGLHWKLPFVQEVRQFDKRLQVWDDDPTQIPTSGREFIWVNAVARWRIVDPLKFLETVETELGADSRLDDILDSVVRDQVSSNPLIELVRSSTWKTLPQEVLEETAAETLEEFQKPIRLGRETIVRAMRDSVVPITSQYGIEVVDLRIKRLNYVESVREKVYTRMVSERKRIAARFRSEGEGRSAETLGAMERQTREIGSDAQRQVQEIRGRAHATAIEISGKAYGQDPEFYAFSETLETLRESREGNLVFVLSTDNDFFRLLKSPIAGPTVPTVPAAPTVPTGPNVPTSP